MFLNIIKFDIYPDSVKRHCIWVSCSSCSCRHISV